MSRINSSVESLMAQSNLSRANSRLSSSLTRLSTGTASNSGNDDPAGLVAGEFLEQELGSIGAAIRNASGADGASSANSPSVAFENITAARSQIVDTDFAAETANLVRNQILVQAGTSVLSIANSRPQSVLSLLGG